MKNKKRYRYIFFILCWVLLMANPVSTLASDGTAGGGEVTTKGKITFYEEGESGESSSSVESTTQDSLPATGGKLPETGEGVKNFSLIGGSLLLVTVLIFFFKKEKKEGNHEN